jgi:hypothetical protein
MSHIRYQSQNDANERKRVMCPQLLLPADAKLLWDAEGVDIGRRSAHDLILFQIVIGSGLVVGIDTGHTVLSPCWRAPEQAHINRDRHGMKTVSCRTLVPRSGRSSRVRVNKAEGDVC